MMFKLACMAAVVIRNPPPWIKRKRPKVQACPTIRLFWLSRVPAPQAPANALNAKKLPGTVTATKQLPDGRRPTLR